MTSPESQPGSSSASPLGDSPVSKNELVRQLTEAAKLLELSGAEGFRANTYANAARQLEAFEGDFAALFMERRLSDLRGIGKTLAAELYALRDQERLDVLNALYTEIPEGVRGLLRVSGLGPKKAGVLWQSGIGDIAALVAAAEDGRLAKLKGFGAKSAETLGAAAAFALNAAERLRLDEAEVLAAYLRAGLEQVLPAAELTWAGELRRGLETVGTLQGVVTGVTAEAVAQALSALGAETQLDGLQVKAVLEGRRLDLYIAEPATFGAALIVQTGDETFVAELMETAAAAGLQLTAAGLFRKAERLETPAETPTETPAETDVFAALGLAYVPPERRDLPLGARGDTKPGSTKTGEAKTNPDGALITLNDLRGLVHNHSSYSDGSASLREMVAAARARGYSYLATADHSKASFYANGLSAERVTAQAREIAEIRRELVAEGSDFKVLHGLEVDIMPDGTLDYPDELLATLDYAVVSVHQHFTLDRAKQTERIVRAVHNPYASILAHATGRLLLRRPSYELELEAVLKACAETGTLVELNANPRRLDLDWRWVVRGLELGCRFAIDPDAHHPDGYDDLRYGVLMARKAGLEAKDVANTAPTAEAFLARLKPKPTR